MHKSISTGFSLVVLLAMASCIPNKEKGYVEIHYFEATANPIPYNTAPTLKGAWTIRREDGSLWNLPKYGKIEKPGGMWVIGLQDSPFQVTLKADDDPIKDNAIEVTTTYTLTAGGGWQGKLENIEVHGTKTCTVNVTPQSMTVPLPLGDYLVVGGADGKGLQEATVKVDRWNAKLRCWEFAPSLKVARMNPVVTSPLDGRVRVSGGTDAKGNAISVEEIYDPASNKWTEQSKP